MSTEQKYCRSSENVLFSHLFPHRKNIVDHLIVNQKMIKSACCRAHKELFIHIRCDICKISINVKINKIANASSKFGRYPSMSFNSIESLHREIHRGHDNFSTIVDVNNVGGGAPVMGRYIYSYKCNWCDYEFYKGADKSSILKILKENSIVHILKDCPKFMESQHAQPMEAFNASDIYNETLRVASDFATCEPKKLNVEYADNFLYSVRPNECGGMSIATCKICGESRAYKSFLKAVSSVYYQIMAEHFLTPLRKLEGSATDFIFPATMNLKEETIEWQHDEYRAGIDKEIITDTWNEYYTEKLNWSCILCLQEYDIGSPDSNVLSTNNGKNTPNKDMIIAHFEVCLAKHISDGRDSVRMIVTKCLHERKYHTPTNTFNNIFATTVNGVMYYFPKEDAGQIDDTDQSDDE